MTVHFWVLLVISAAFAALGCYLYRLKTLKIDQLKVSLEEANQKLQSHEESYIEKENQWEQNEAKLRGYLQLMDILINTIPNPIYFKDKDGVFQGCNRVFSKQILGLTRDRIIGSRPQDLPEHIPPDLAAVYQREENKVMEKDGPHTFEAQVQRSDGERRDFLFSIAPVTKEDGQSSGTVAVLSDLTDKNRAAQDRMQKEKLEGVLETAGAVCHELNQPLQALSGYVELMSVQSNNDDDSAYIEKLTTQIERMRDIIDKLHGVTRYEVIEYAGDTKIIDIHKFSR